MPKKYVLSTFNGDHKDENHVRILTNKLRIGKTTK
jgi:hypothetical protein